MAQVNTDLLQVITVLKDPMAPPNLIGVLVQPDSSPAGPVQIQFAPAQLNDPSPVVTVVNDEAGAFRLPLPKGMSLPAGSTLRLTVHGGGGNSVDVDIPAIQVASNGLVGALMLPTFVAPLPVSILASLQALAPPPDSVTPDPPPTNQPQLPVVSLGDDSGCLLQYGANSSVDRFPFGVFCRLVEPRASIVSEVQPITIKPGSFTYLPAYTSMAFAIQDEPGRSPSTGLADRASPALPESPPALPEDGVIEYVDRVPVEQPISVDGFRDQLMGLLEDGTFTGDETRPMAGTLGIGYVLHMSQRWTFQGLALGDLVYSLPLAPGEQQRIAIFERVDTARVSESEFFSEAQAQQQRALADTSTQATFQSAFSESIRGTSSFQTESDSSGWGGNFIIVSGGGGSSSSSGSSAQSLQGQRNTTQTAAQNTHSSAENQASARRSASRTGMRVATASESEHLTTRVITNHNHMHAMTMQYWEVQRLYDVTTAIDGLTLTVLVPLQVVRFMGPGQPAILSDPTLVDSRAEVLNRYSEIIKHSDVLRQALPHRYRHGLTMLTQFAADPTAVVDPAGGAAQDIITFSVDGTFLACEDVYVTAVTDRGTRLGPVKLASSAGPPPADTFESREQLVEWLTQQREGGSINFTGALALPQSMNRSSVVGFEISRAFRSLSYTLITPEFAQLKLWQKEFGAAADVLSKLTGLDKRARRTTVVLSPGDLERHAGGPRLTTFSATITEVDAAGNGVPGEQYANHSLGSVELPQQAYPLPAQQLAPVLRYSEVLEIEAMATHVVRGTLTYSRAIWSSMSDMERAILLEAYTIGVPPGGVQDATQMVPLLNCVENKVLGYFGNSMIMPFIIPQALTDQERVGGQPIDPVRLHDSLLAYQTATFTPPHSTIALPTRGVLAEAVLGHCSSAEKIDLRRFWNWQDSPADSAPEISPVTLPTDSESIAAGLEAPNSLTNLPSLINNVLTAPSPDNSLLSALAAAAAAQKDFDSGLTGATQLAGLLTNSQNLANSARADSLRANSEYRAQAMATVGNILGGIYGGNPEAGSKAAASVNRSGSGATASPSGTPSGQTQTPAPAPAAGGGKTGGPTSGPSGAPTGGPTGTPTGGGGAGTPTGGGAGTPTGGGTGAPSGGPPGGPSGAPPQSPRGLDDASEGG
ncbi:hypothetical protein [Nocardioides sp. zg-1228]|uniref:hypothetical protein n=1 Tax=Nocardioides sp. zg-1228 TaxID=2763008 RepID=UPI0016430F6B|nr:hypothetical protein [Nocardioides sp. zg-1228]MBC2932487.1 hypothetical protein [Nocardioides sp. zg-1228]QSF57993.1 hypothetical protein JX575_01820 [Nocardioides sp. zg-1228]